MLSDLKELADKLKQFNLDGRDNIKNGEIGLDAMGRRIGEVVNQVRD